MKKIIFADDDPTIQDVINLIFNDEYEITVYPEGGPLLRKDFEVPNLFLLDRQLSGMDGLDICRHLKAQPETRDVPIIIISATPDIQKLARNAGADDVIEKPFAIKELRIMVAKHVDKL